MADAAYSVETFRRRATKFFADICGEGAAAVSSYANGSDMIYFAELSGRSVRVWYLDYADGDRVFFHVDESPHLPEFIGLAVYISGNFEEGLATSAPILKRWLILRDPVSEF
jgi:hypothetical protein